MSGRRSKQLRRRAEDLLIEWLRTMVPDGEDTSKIHRKILMSSYQNKPHSLQTIDFFLVHIVYDGFTNK